MKSFETTATVENHGEIRLAGVPFAPGTEVEITVKPAHHGEPSATDRAARLLSALDKARNTVTAGPLRREELYDRKVLY